MLTLAEAVFGRDSADLLPSGGTCFTCPKGTGANTALFDDFAEDDRCLDAACFKAKVDAHIAALKENTAGLVQITRAYYTDGKGEEKVLTRNEYTIIEPKQRTQNAEGEHPAPADPPCSKATSAVVVKGPGKRGDVVQVCADLECEDHGKPNYRAEQEKAVREREREWKRQQEVGAKHQKANRRLLDAVLNAFPKSLTRDDYEMLVVAAIDGLEYEPFDAACERYNIDTDEVHEPDAGAFGLRKLAQGKTEAQLVRMLVELALLPCGFLDERLPPHDPLASAAARYGVSLVPNKQVKAHATKCAPKADSNKPKTKTTTKPKTAAKKAAKKGGAA